MAFFEVLEAPFHCLCLRVFLSLSSNLSAVCIMRNVNSLFYVLQKDGGELRHCSSLLVLSIQV